MLYNSKAKVHCLPPCGSLLKLNVIIHINYYKKLVEVKSQCLSWQEENGDGNLNSKASLHIPIKTKIWSAELDIQLHPAETCDVQLQPAETCDVTRVYFLSYGDAVVISEVLVVQLVAIALISVESHFKLYLAEHM